MTQTQKATKDLPQLYSDLAEAIIAVTNHPDAPKAVTDALEEAVVGIGNQMGTQEVTDEYVREVLARVGQMQAKPGELRSADTADHPAPADDRRVYQEIGAAFATLEEHRDYLPTKLYNDLGDAIQEWADKAQWQSTPELIRVIFPLLAEHADQQEGGE